MIKKIAERILRNELQDLREKRDYYEKRYWDSEHRCCDYHTANNNLEQEIQTLKDCLKNRDQVIDDLNAQNEIMRKHYHVDEEPTDSIKMSILIDLRIHDLERQLILEKIQHIKDNSQSNIVYSLPMQYARWQKW